MEKKITKKILLGEEAVRFYFDNEGIKTLKKELDECGIPYKIIERTFTEEEWKVYETALKDVNGWWDFILIDD